MTRRDDPETAKHQLSKKSYLEKQAYGRTPGEEEHMPCSVLNVILSVER
jgi:hypothetical protein